MDQKLFRISLLIAILSFVTACNSTVERNEEDYNPQTAEDRRSNDMKSLITKSDEPMVIYGSKSGGSGGVSGGNLIANSYLWRAALDSISFMPLTSVDSNSGVILTDWYGSPSTPNEKFKFNIIVLSSELQISSIKVTAFRQIQGASGQWRAADVSRELVRNVEDNILKKAIAMNAKASK
jgi:hypothetical protein